MLTTGFLLITIASLGLLYWASGKDLVVTGFFSVWALVVGLLAWNGFFEVTDSLPPRMLQAPLPAFVLVVMAARRIPRKQVVPMALLLIHSLRIAVEICLHELYLDGQIPRIMTWEGWNFDVLIGISALIMALYSFISGQPIPRRFLQIWNLIGLLFLINIVTIAVLSIPSPFQSLAFTQPNVAVLHFPFTLLPGIVVPIVALAHVWGLRRLGLPAG